MLFSNYDDIELHSLISPGIHEKTKEDVQQRLSFLSLVCTKIFIQVGCTTSPTNQATSMKKESKITILHKLLESKAPERRNLPR